LVIDVSPDLIVRSLDNSQLEFNSRKEANAKNVVVMHIDGQKYRVNAVIEMIWD